MFENSSKIVIVMEYASKGDLYDYISERQRLTEQEARHFFRQVVSAVYYCHKVGRPRASHRPPVPHGDAQPAWEVRGAGGWWLNPAFYQRVRQPSGLRAAAFGKSLPWFFTAIVWG